MEIVTGHAKAIEGGKAHKLCDFQTAGDVTLIRIENLSAAHALEVFGEEEEAVTTVNSYSIPAQVAEKTPSFIELPYDGGTIFGAGVGGEVNFRVIGVVAQPGGPGIATGTA